MTVDPPNVRILLVEDAAVMRRIEVKTLKKLGFESISEAENGHIAIQKIRQEPVDLIISDWNMPVKDGLELLKWVRSEQAYRHLPFLMATGQGDKRQERKAIDAGVSSFVAKPFNADELRQKIDEAFGLVASASASAAAGRSPQKTAAGRVRLKVAHIQITDHLVLGVLKALIEQGQVTPRYFELETECLPGWNPVQQALEQGRVDAACVLAPIAMDLFSFGVPIKLILLAHKGGSICVRSRQGELREPFASYFKNKSFYIPHKLSVHHMLAHLFFSRIGLTSGMVGDGEVDVKYEVVAPVKMPGFLKDNADACGFMVAEPVGTKAISAGVARLQFLSNELWENHPCCVVAVRDDFIEPCTDAVHEFTEMLVQAGKFVAEKPELAAEIGVKFLDPDAKLGLKVPILKNVLKEELGIKTIDLYPAVEDLERMQQYLVHRMGIGSPVDLNTFVDTRFADAACKDRISSRLPSILHDADDTAAILLNRGAAAGDAADKSMLSREGKYLTFALNEQEFGIDILKIKEIIGMTAIRSIPRAPAHLKGVINLRGQVIPVMDLRLRFGMPPSDYSERSCIIVLDLAFGGRAMLIGVAVDSVSEVLQVKSTDIEPPPYFGVDIDTRHILAMTTMDGRVKTLLDIDRVLNEEDQLAILADSEASPTL